MMNTPFRETDKDRNQQMTILYAQIFAVAMQAGKPMLQSIIWLNENFEKVYETSETDVQIYEYIFDELGIQYTKKI